MDGQAVSQCCSKNEVPPGTPQQHTHGAERHPYACPELGTHAGAAAPTCQLCVIAAAHSKEEHAAAWDHHDAPIPAQRPTFPVGGTALERHSHCWRQARQSVPPPLARLRKNEAVPAVRKHGINGIKWPAKGSLLALPGYLKRPTLSELSGAVRSPAWSQAARSSAFSGSVSEQ